MHLLVSQYGPSFVAQCCQIAGPHSPSLHAAGLPLASARIYLSVSMRLHVWSRILTISPCCRIAGSSLAHMRAPCGRARVFPVGTQDCSLLAHKRIHRRRTREFQCWRIRVLSSARKSSLCCLVGAQSYPVSAHKSVLFWRTSVFIVGAEVLVGAQVWSLRCASLRSYNLFGVYAGLISICLPTSPALVGCCREMVWLGQPFVSPLGCESIYKVWNRLRSRPCLETCSRPSVPDLVYVDLCLV